MVPPPPSFPGNPSFPQRDYHITDFDPAKRSCHTTHDRELTCWPFLAQRNLNNAFAYDLVPSPTVLVAALKAARRINDYPTAVRIFEGKLSPLPSRQCLYQHRDRASRRRRGD